HSGRRRHRACPGRGRAVGADTEPGPAHRARGARRRAGPVPGGPRGVRRRGLLRTLRRTSTLRAVRRPGVPAGGGDGGAVRLVWRAGGVAMCPGRGGGGAGAGHRGAGPRPGGCLASGGAGLVAGGARDPAVTVPTPGAQPLAEEGYAAAVLLDGWAL